MIISVSRRTDIPAFYGQWFENRLKAGYCMVRNPIFPEKQYKVSLLKEDVDAFVFWTKNAKPFIKTLDLIDELNIPYYFQYSLNPYNSSIEQNINKEEAFMAFKNISNRIGKDRIIWRYDPILFNEYYTESWHLKHFDKFCKLMKEYTNKVVISFVDKNYYMSYHAKDIIIDDLNKYIDFSNHLRTIAFENDLLIESCAENEKLGFIKGKCIDDKLIENITGKKLNLIKDNNQRFLCGCVKSRDIGYYNTCLHGCIYCYAKTIYKIEDHDANREYL